MKNYRILRISGLHYDQVVSSFLKKHPKFKEKSYKDNLQILFEEGATYSDGFSRSFRKLGQEAYELVIDFEILQKQWANENGTKYSSERWMFDIMMAQISKIRPDVVYIQSHMFTVPGLFLKDRPKSNLIKILKETYPFIKTVAIFSGYPSSADRIEGADIIFSSPPAILEDYKKKGLNPILLYHSFDEQILKKLNGAEKIYGFTFAGSTRAPESRYWLLKQLLDQTALKAWIVEPAHQTLTEPPTKNTKQKVRSALKRCCRLMGTHQVHALANSSYIPDAFRSIFLEISKEPKGFAIPKEPATSLYQLYPGRCHSSVLGMEMYNLLYQSKVTFNKHTDQAWGDVGNMRMFEATGVGACLLTDNGANMLDLFEPDKEVVTYSCKDEAIEKVTYLLDHPAEAAQIAKAGQARTLQDHNMLNRCMQIDEAIKARL
jgi:spore maturation protein CgeB